jgi:two-component system cell cycle sensor histidine kinase/response regulator CckA
MPVKALIVDDQPDNIYLLESLLRGNGYETVTASNGEEALKILRKEKTDLVISDILMPVMDGFQLCRKIKTDAELSVIPFIIYTATYTGPQDETFALKIGADRFLVKPCEPEVIIQAVVEVLGKLNTLGRTQEIDALEEEEVLRLYSERLVRKLEQKVLEAEREIKARVKAEEALRISHERLVEAQRIAGMGSFTWNVDTGKVTWTEAMYELLGYDKNDKNIDLERVNKSIHHACDLERVTEWLQNSTASTVSKAGPEEYRISRNDGVVLTVQTFLSIKRDKNGRAEEVFGTVQNISDRKAAEEEREKLCSQLAMAHRLESVGRLANSVAHDFNNFLMVIMGRGESLLLQMGEDDHLRNDVEEIVEVSNKSVALTRQLLTFSRKQKLMLMEIDLNSVLKSIEGMLKRLVGNDVTIEMKLAASLPLISSDLVHLEQVLMNLAVNSRDAMSGRGKLLIETADCQLDSGFTRAYPNIQPGRFVMLRISDTGHGIPDEVLPYIFDPFFTTRENDKGTGLGLSTVYGIVKQSGGMIAVDSVVGEGAVFTIYLPAISNSGDSDTAL